MLLEVHGKLRDEQLIARNNKGRGLLDEPAALISREMFEDEDDDALKVTLEGAKLLGKPGWVLGAF
ncbi:hypothetical protein GCM10007928_43900 [Sulfitobacter porphyrae]|nr:hypothetical protein GCM10007928_43900 [Sulfitobacter porphyrae]